MERSAWIEIDPAEALAIQLIDTPPFQRLRRIRQLGPAYLTFHGAESSRFTHSLGVLQLARRALLELCHREPALERDAGRPDAAALLHDVGHGPRATPAKRCMACTMNSGQRG